MKYFYLCALLFPIIVSAYPSRDDTLSGLKSKFRLNKIDENINEEVNADVDLVPDESVASDGIDAEMSAEFQKFLMNLKIVLPELIENLLKSTLNEVPDMSVASDALGQNNVVNEEIKDLKPDMSVVEDAQDNLLDAMPEDLTQADPKPDIFVFPEAEDNHLPDMPDASNIFYKNLRLKGLLNKINY